MENKERDLVFCTPFAVPLLSAREVVVVQDLVETPVTGATSLMTAGDAEVMLMATLWRGAPELLLASTTGLPALLIIERASWPQYFEARQLGVLGGAVRVEGQSLTTFHCLKRLKASLDSISDGYVASRCR